MNLCQGQSLLLLCRCDGANSHLLSVDEIELPGAEEPKLEWASVPVADSGIQGGKCSRESKYLIGRCNQLPRVLSAGHGPEHPALELCVLGDQVFLQER